jgi:hypothetical protein
MGSLERQEADAFEASFYEYDAAGQPKFGWQVSKAGRWWNPPPKGWRPPPPQVPDNPREALPELWAFGRRVYEEILALWGSPSDLMAQHGLFGREGVLCRDWVRHLEHLVRCILIIAALTLEVVPPRPRLSPKRATDPNAAPRTRLIKTEEPSTWPVSFRVFPSTCEARSRRSSPRSPKRNYMKVRGLALRIEALYRVLKTQDPYVRRLACRMARIREANRTANRLKTFALKPWTYPYDFYGRTSGQHAVQVHMTPAHVMAGRLLGPWHDLAPG